MPHRQSPLTSPLNWSSPPLEVRTITLGINAGDLANRHLNGLCEGLYQRIVDRATQFSGVCTSVAADLGIPILQRRVCVSPLDRLAEGHGPDDLVNIGRTLDGAAASAHIDQISGFFVRAAHGLSRGTRQLFAALPAILAQTDRVHAAVEAATSAGGVNMDAVGLLGGTIRDAALASSSRKGTAAARLAVLANFPDDSPPIAGAFSGDGWGDLVVFVSVSMMGPIRHAIERRLQKDPHADLSELASDIRAAAFQATRLAEMVGRGVAQRMNAAFGRIDVSLAPTIRPGQTITELLNLLGISAFGSPGSATALAMIWSAMHSGGRFASTAAASQSSILLPILRDSGLVSATEAGSLGIEHLSYLSAVCGQGLDLIPIPGETSATTISALVADQLAAAALSGRTAVARLVPVPEHVAGDRVSFGRDLGDATVLHVPLTSGGAFINRGGQLAIG